MVQWFLPQSSHTEPMLAFIFNQACLQLPPVTTRPGAFQVSINPMPPPVVVQATAAPLSFRHEQLNAHACFDATYACSWCCTNPRQAAVWADSDSDCLASRQQAQVHSAQCALWLAGCRDRARRGTAWQQSVLALMGARMQGWAILQRPIRISGVGCMRTKQPCCCARCFRR